MTQLRHRRICTFNDVSAQVVLYLAYRGPNLCANNIDIFKCQFQRRSSVVVGRSSYLFQCSMWFWFEYLAIARDYRIGSERNGFYVFQFFFSADICIGYWPKICSIWRYMRQLTWRKTIQKLRMDAIRCMISDVDVETHPKSVQYRHICIS